MSQTRYSDFHGFLINHRGELNAAARSLPDIRQYISNRPQTASTFDATNLPVPPSTQVTKHHLELCYAWPFVDDYGPTGNNRRFVNPQYPHAHRFSDLIVECECGARFVKNYEVDDSPIQQASQHTESCMPFHRLEARAEMSRRRYNKIRRLGWLGWKGPDIAPRIGVTRNHTGGYSREYGITLRENYEQYRYAVANTSAYLILRGEADLSTMADIYGHSTKSIRDWAKKHTPFETKTGRVRSQTWEDVEMDHPPHVDDNGTDSGRVVWDPQKKQYVTQ